MDFTFLKPYRFFEKRIKELLFTFLGNPLSESLKYFGDDLELREDGE